MNLLSFKKYFRKLTYFDYIVILFIALITLFVYIFFNRSLVITEIRFKVTNEDVLFAKNNPPNEYALGFTVGDTEKDELGRMVSEIIGVETYKLKPDETVVYLNIKLKSVYNPRKNQYTFRGKTLAIGESIVFTFTKIKARALVVDLPNQIPKRLTNIIRVKAQVRNEQQRYYSDIYGSPSYIATALKPGDKVINQKGEALVLIQEVSVFPAKRTIVANNGTAVTILDPELKDIFLTLDILSRNVDGRNYAFDYIPIQIGNIIPINLPNVAIWPTITEIIN